MTFSYNGFSDTNIFHRSLELIILSQERVEADKCYWGKYHKVDFPNQGFPKKSASLQKYTKTRIWVRQKANNGRFKQFNCLKNVWRHDPQKHKMIFCYEAVPVQLGLQYKRGLFKVNYKTKKITIIKICVIVSNYNFFYFND